MFLHYRIHLAGIGNIAAVNQHGFSITWNQCGICLPYIDKADLQLAVLLVCVTSRFRKTRNTNGRLQYAAISNMSASWSASSSVRFSIDFINR